MIYLRGHHIDNFASYYLGQEMIEKKRSSFYRMSIVGIPMKVVPTQQELLEGLYGKDKLVHFQTQFKILSSKNKCDITIVEGLDSLCGNDCGLFDSSCITRNNLFDEDQYSLLEYGLSIGHILSNIDLQNLVYEYKEKEGFFSPREKYYLQQHN